MKKLCSIVLSSAIIGILSFGLNNSVEILQSAHGDYPAPQKTGLTYTHGDHFITKSTHANKGDTWSSSYSHADLPISAEGDHGGSPSYDHADTPASQA